MYTTSISKNCGSHRTSVPMGLMNWFNLKKGDKLQWIVEGDKITIKPIKNKEGVE